MSMPTLLDVIERNGTDAVVGLIDECTKAVPEVRLGAARTIRGLNYRTRVRTSLPNVGFRQVNQGSAVDKQGLEQRLIECYLMNPPFQCDKAAADAAEDGAAAYLAEEGEAIVQAAFQALGVACFYGAHATFGKTDGFPGFLQAYDTTDMVVDAGGTTDSEATSIWLVRWGKQDAQWVLGEGGRAEVSDPIETVLYDANNNPYDGYHQSFYLRPGLQVGSKFSLCRIKKVTTDSGKGLTDALLDQALEKFPAGRPPSAIYMTRRSRRQLKNSRTATTPTGKPAEWPDSVDGPEGPIPIYTTDSLVNTETLAL